MKLCCTGTRNMLDQVFELLIEEMNAIGLDEMSRDLFFGDFVEAVHNAVEHGNGNDEEKNLQIETLITPWLGYISLEDEGGGFVPEFPDLKTVYGARGRGLGMIKENTDEVFFNNKGNKIVLWTYFNREKKMHKDYENASMELEELGRDSVLITNFQLSPSGLLHHALSEIFLDKLSEDTKTVLLDASGIRVFSSLGWGVLANFLNQSEDCKVILFNISPAIDKMGQTLGFGESGVYPNITLLPKAQQAVGSF